MAVDKEAVAARLMERGAIKACERCGHATIAVYENFVSISTVPPVQFGDIRLGATEIPCAIIACTNCGNLTFHSLGQLDLL